MSNELGALNFRSCKQMRFESLQPGSRGILTSYLEVGSLMRYWNWGRNIAHSRKARFKLYDRLTRYFQHRWFSRHRMSYLSIPLSHGKMMMTFVQDIDHF